MNQGYAPQGSGPQAMAGSGNAAAGAKPALDGYCPVCLVDSTQWVAGKPEFGVTYDGVNYLFPGAEQMAKFQAAPTNYAPVLGGGDVVAFAQTGRRVPGLTRYGSKYEGRFFFFTNESNKQTFMADPARYANADLALGGDCTVCKLDMNSKKAGDPRVSVVHNGIRYFFVSDQQRQQFVANPARYVTHSLTTPSGSSSKGSGSGSAPAGSGTGSGSY